VGVAEEGAAGDEAVVTGDEVLTPIAGRISDRTVDRRGGHAAASVLLAAGAAAAVLAGRAPADARRTGNNRNGVFTGVWTAGETLGLALGPGLYAVVLAAGGYVSIPPARSQPSRRRCWSRSSSGSRWCRPCWYWHRWSRCPVAV